jgi:hypothetical protein
VTATGTTTGNRKKPPDGRTLQRAEVLLRRAHLDHEPDVGWERMVAMLARVLDRHDPFTSEHGGLLVAALRVRTRKERRAGPRPPAEHAVRHLLGHGEPPWPRAVTAAQERQQQHDQARARQLVRLAPTATRDGPTAARLVADHWREHGRPPGPVELGKALGWPSHDRWAVIHLLVEAGWLALHHRQLQPGPRARQPAPAAGHPVDVP